MNIKREEEKRVGMKDIIMDRLNKIEDLEQRKLLKNIMTGVFLNLAEYQEDMNQRLEQRIFSEVENNEENYDVFVTLCPKDEVDPAQEFLYPIRPEDIENKTYDLKEIASKLSQQEDVILLTVFLECDYLKIKELIGSRRNYRGEIVTTAGTYEIGVRLEQNKRYLREIERLYQAFQKNSIPWRTVNNPYANKFFDVSLVNCEGIIGEDEEVLEIKVNLEEFEPFKMSNMVPLWNIERLAVKSTSFPVPAQDRINYENILSLRKLGTEHGYLVDEEEGIIKYLKRTPEELNIVSSVEKSGTWEVLKIIKPIQMMLGRLEYGLVSNKRKNNFSNKFAQIRSANVRTESEIVRIINSFEVSKDLELEQVEIKKPINEISETYNMNQFLTDNVRVERDKKVMLLKFRARDDSNFITRDIMSFLVSELQMHFPDYRCEGTLT